MTAPKRDERAVDHAIRRLDALMRQKRLDDEIERIKRLNEQPIPAGLKRQAG